MATNKKNINLVRIDEIRPYPNNAKKHPKRQVQQIADSIKMFGFNQPIVVDKDNVVIVGHGRLVAARILRLEQVPVIKVDLSEEKAMAYRLADNKLNESDWEMERVIEELKKLSLELVDLTGFDRDLIVEDDDKDDVIPTVTISKTKIGDFYHLGVHKLFCGDSTDKDAVNILIGNIKADMIFTDPPYNVNYAGRGKNTSKGIENDNMDEVSFTAFLKKVFDNYSHKLKEGGAMYVFHASSSQDQFKRAMEDAGFEIKNQMIWNKPTASMGWGDYRWKHEPFFYAGFKGSSIQFYGDRTHSTIWDFQDDENELINWAKKQKRLEKQGKTTIWTMKRDNVQEYKHPTQKPVELISYALTNSSKRGDIILDLFGGSGSTLIAAEKMHRESYIMELDPKYCDLIVQRYVDYTMNPDIKLNGEPFNWPLSDKATKTKNDEEPEEPTTE